jgi:predicted Zn-dependent protease
VALQQFELLLHTSESQNGRYIEASKQVGNLVHGTDELRAADCWETMLLCCLKPNWGFVENGGYVQIPQLVHKSRAKGLIKAGRIENAVQEAWTSHRTAPANTELAEEVFPLLMAAGREEDANAIFDQTANHLRELTRQFPRCATFHNNTAWLFARCGRHLDEALTHARQATNLEPGRTSYVDTLAEVHFQLGQYAEAIRCAEQCVRAEPRNTHYRSQLERFRSMQVSGS